MPGPAGRAAFQTTEPQDTKLGYAAATCVALLLVIGMHHSRVHKPKTLEKTGFLHYNSLAGPPALTSSTLLGANKWSKRTPS